MRTFFEEYGAAILVLLVLCIILLMSSPIGSQIKEGVVDRVQNKETNVTGDYGTEKIIVTFNDNGGSGGPGSLVKYSNKTAVIPSTIPSKSGFAFGGWSEVKDDDNVLYPVGSDISFTANKTLFAYWVKGDYVITYHLNCNEFTTQAVTTAKSHGKNVKLYTEDSIKSALGLSGDKLRNGYNLKGWALTNTAKEAKYAPKSDFTINASTVLYAVWEPEGYTVSYNANGGTGAPSDQTKKYGEDLTLSTKVPLSTSSTKDNFTYWTDQQSGSGNQYSPGSTYTANSKVDLYAQWADDVYNITLNANGGTVNGKSSDTLVKAAGTNLVLPTASKSGSDFLGWSEKNGTTAEYPIGTPFSKDKATTLYAIFGSTYTVTYHENGTGVSNMPVAQTKQQGVALVLSNTVPTTSGSLSFSGWSTSSSSNVIAYKPGGVYYDDANLDLYAVWGGKTYTVTYDLKGGKSTKEETSLSQSKIKGVDLEIITDTPSKDGCVFRYWCTNQNGVDGTKYGYALDTDGKYKYPIVYTTDADLTLYAIYDEVKCNLSYNLNGASVKSGSIPSAKDYSYNADFTVTNAVLTSTLPNFVGWSDVKNSSSAKYESGKTYKIVKDLVLYPIFVNNEYQISFNAKESDVTNLPSPQTKKYGETLTLSKVVPIRFGYTFKGWYLESDSSTYYKAGSSFTVESSTDLKLYAAWDVNDYTITYNLAGGTYNSSTKSITESKTHGVDYTITSKEPTKTGFTFLGWSRSQSALTAEYVKGDKYKTNASLSLYAVYQGNTATITYDANGGTGGPDPQQKDYGVTITLTNEVPVRTGYAFLYWTTKKDGTGTKYAKGSSYSSNDSVTLYAQWKYGVAQIGSTIYEKLADAITAAGVTDTIVMINNTTEDCTFPSSKKLIVNTNGKTITGVHKVNGGLTVKGTGKFVGNKATHVFSVEGGTFTLESGTITNTSGGCLTSSGAAKITLEGGAISKTGTLDAACVSFWGTSTVNIYGTDLLCEGTQTNCIGLYTYDSAVVNMSGGSITSDQEAVYQDADGGKFTMSGGKIIGKNAYEGGVCRIAQGKAYFTGGTITSDGVSFRTTYNSPSSSNLYVSAENLTITSSGKCAVRHDVGDIDFLNCTIKNTSSTTFATEHYGSLTGSSGYASTKKYAIVNFESSSGLLNSNLLIRYRNSDGSVDEHYGITGRLGGPITCTTNIGLGYNEEYVQFFSSYWTPLQLPTWSVESGQDDLIWMQVDEGSGNQKFIIKIADHNYDIGKYYCDLYHSWSTYLAHIELNMGKEPAADDAYILVSNPKSGVWTNSTVPVTYTTVLGSNFVGVVRYEYSYDNSSWTDADHNWQSGDGFIGTDGGTASSSTDNRKTVSGVSIGETTKYKDSYTAERYNTVYLRAVLLKKNGTTVYSDAASPALTNGGKGTSLICIDYTPPDPTAYFGGNTAAGYACGLHVKAYDTSGTQYMSCEWSRGSGSGSFPQYIQTTLDVIVINTSGYAHILSFYLSDYTGNAKTYGQVEGTSPTITYSDVPWIN